MNTIANDSEIGELIADVPTLEHWPLNRVRMVLDGLFTVLTDLNTPPRSDKSALAKSLEKLRFQEVGRTTLYFDILKTLKGKNRTRLRQFFKLSKLAAALEQRLASR